MIFEILEPPTVGAWDVSLRKDLAAQAPVWPHQASIFPRVAMAKTGLLLRNLS